jgi:acylphosphatase
MSSGSTIHYDGTGEDALRQMATLIDEDITQGESHPALGPQYFVARRMAEDFMAKFQEEHFKPLVDEFAEKFRDKLWSDITASFLSDTESNLHGEIRNVLDGTIQALLTGKGWMINRFPLAQYYDGKDIRQAIFDQCRDQLTDARVTDLETEVSRLREQLRFYQER